MYKYDMELANVLDIIPADAISPPQNVTARCEVSSHSRQDSDPENVHWNSLLLFTALGGVFRD